MAEMNGHATNQPDLGGCPWIPWKSSFIQNSMPDPTRLFSLLVIGIMNINFLISHEWDFSLVVSGFLLNPWVVGFFAFACATVWAGQPSGKVAPLKVYDRWAAEWYWWNAWLYHATMDGAGGTFRLIPVVVQQYDVLDKRFVMGHAVPWTVGLVEILVMQPLCLATLFAILKRSPYRFPLELITSTFQLMGMILFVVAEVYEGQLNVPAQDPVGVEGNAWANVKFNQYHLTYYWFGFWFCNIVWCYVPYYRILRAAQECARSLQQTTGGISSSKAD